MLVPAMLLAVVVAPVIVAAVIGAAEAPFPVIDLEKLVPAQLTVAFQCAVPVPVPERFVALQPVWHVLRAPHFRVVVGRLVMPAVRGLVRRGVGRVDQHQATGQQGYRHYFVHIVLRIVPVQLQNRRGGMNRR